MLNRKLIRQNVIIEKNPPGDWELFLSQLKSPLIYILLLASVITLYLRDYLDTSIILIAVVLNTILGFIQERKAQHGLAALKKILTPKARVNRNGHVELIDARDIRVDDVVVISAGDRTPADGTLLEEVNLYINEAILTGESMPVAKNSKDALVYSGTTVTSGRGLFRVTAIGMDTKLGAIAGTLEETPEEETPLQRQLRILARVLAMIVCIISIFILIVGLLRGENFVTMFSIAVAIAVAAIPEGMVVSLTVILSLGMQRILKKQAIVRRLASAETLGSVNVLCVDKTGTLTEGIMRVVETKLTDHAKAIQTAVLANNLENPIDNALWEWVQGQDHFDPQEITETSPRTHEIPFDGTKKFMLVATQDGIWVKGAPEVLLSQSQGTKNEKELWIRSINSFAQKGLRVIGLAWKPKRPKDAPDNNLSDLSFLGIIGVSDPIRQGVKEALEVATRAGIDIKVVTGDYRVTSEAILNQLGIKIRDGQREIVEGKELESITTDDLARRVDGVRLFCRVTPEQKLKIVEALQKNGKVVAMTGDGVNDALALKKSDIGIVVASASDVAKDTADLVLLDSNFKTIVAAVEEGRVIFQNIRKVTLYLLSDAGTEMILIVLSIIAGLPLPLTAIQILWINILSDGFPNLALAFEQKEYDVMRHTPKDRSVSIINRGLRVLILVTGLLKALIAFTVYVGVLNHTQNLLYAQTLTFVIVGTGSLFYVFAIRNLSKSIIHANIFKNPYLVYAAFTGLFLQLLVIYHPWFTAIFKTQPLSLNDWILVVGSGLILILGIDYTKAILRKYKAL